MTFINHPLVGIMFALDKELRRYLDQDRYPPRRPPDCWARMIEGDIAGHRVMLTNAGLGKVSTQVLPQFYCLIGSSAG